ncbi:MAG: 16S rRNA (cytidine(1402)-2'-O)-methyltransferase [Acidimicrobiales bacterium]
MSPKGVLVLVATPIGNVGDLAARAAQVLASADVIFCEDTRHSGQLFARVGVRPKRLVSLHEHNEAARTDEVLAMLEAGLTVAVVSDAGTPAISDPGARVVSAVHDAGLQVSAVPGPSAVAAAAALAGLGDGRWHFEGFLPKKTGERRSRLSEVVSSKVPSVIYEAPGRVQGLLTDLAGLCESDRLVAVCRELTKLHEEVWRGPLDKAAERWPAPTARGEFVVVLDGQRDQVSEAPLPAELAGGVLELTSRGLSRRDAVAEVAERAGLSRRQVYDALGPPRSRKRPTTDGL